MTYHIGAFIKETLKPLIEELDALLGKCQNLNLDKKTIETIVYTALDFELRKARWLCVMYCILGICFCLMTYLILGG